MATITTKFNVGDKVFTIDEKTMKIREFEVAWISVFVHGGKEPSVSYKSKDDSAYFVGCEEAKCFATKHELLTYIEQPAQSDE